MWINHATWPSRSRWSDRDPLYSFNSPPPVRVVLQRAREARVTVEGKVVGEIGLGHLLLVGFKQSDTTDQVEWMADKVVGLRIFQDESGKMNRTLADVHGSILVVSQFTVYGSVRKGRRPSFVAAAPPEVAISLYDHFVELLEARRPGRVATGEFGAMMDVSLSNNGPVTLVIDR